MKRAHKVEAEIVVGAPVKFARNSAGSKSNGKSSAAGAAAASKVEAKGQRTVEAQQPQFVVPSIIKDYGRSCNPLRVHDAMVPDS